MNKQQRQEHLLPHGRPRYVRCYDSGPDEGTDRYTVVFTSKRGGFYVGLNAVPTHPSYGVYQHGDGTIDAGRIADYKRPPAIGRKCHLGTRIAFDSLPLACQRPILREYCELWEVELPQWVNHLNRTPWD